jgi:hypothetical protein
MHRKTQCKKAQRQETRSGSVMVMILVAVMLFAALGYAVSENMRGGSPEVLSAELAKNHASEIFQFSSSVRRAVQSLKIDGIADTDISFENPILSGYTNGTCETCRVFSSRGGGINYIKPAQHWLDPSRETSDHYRTWLFTGGAFIDSVGTGANELLMIVPYIRQGICMEINKKLEINMPSGQPAQEGTDAWDSNVALARFTGDYSGSEEIGDGSALYQNTRAGCFEGSGSNTPPAGTYHYYEVLLAR